MATAACLLTALTVLSRGPHGPCSPAKLPTGTVALRCSRLLRWKLAPEAYQLAPLHTLRLRSWPRLGKTGSKRGGCDRCLCTRTLP